MIKIDNKKKCEFCEVDFKPNKRDQKFCSQKCYLSTIRKKRILTVCAWCDKLIVSHTILDTKPITVIINIEHFQA